MVTWIRATAASICIVAFVSPVQAGDPYLEMLEKEAQTLELIRNTERQDKTTADASEGKAGPVGLAIAGNLSRDGLDQALRDRFVGTNLLYEKLPEQEKNNVYRDYLRDPRIMEVRRAIASRL